ncbi:lysophospholipid acyltransferase family protein [Mucilaginibacter sp.]|uniref:lysophospholipid acyltransferase family protein n=1 Tax=Mucilaginibacter sp. TaxID=1882438 RepID=UPI000CB1D84B|nr:lysophospholipid acyltransferase family protein [Mucilaginibacter sp.]PLW88457.1 MAG: lauroyl acyltransferase [Mucilaginibacter sp.]HEK20320.1 lauroyl acyltransferase [Bacteroidota bacterium]
MAAIKQLWVKFCVSILYLISLLPFWALYLLSDVIYVILFYLVRYRRQVVHSNLVNSFPEKSLAEISTIEKQYYHYLGDLLVETLKMITMSEKSLRKRMQPTNPELVNHYFAQGRSIIAAAGHYCNWELAILGFSLLTTEKRVIVYKPLSNAWVNDYVNRVRARYGAIMVAMKQTLRTFVSYRNDLTFSVLVSDQTPVRHEINYVTTFLSQPTPVFLGIEKLAKMIDAVVIFYKIERVKRGYYRFTMVPLIEQPKQTAEHEITEAHVRFLEQIIRDKPQYWLWSHRRWKYKPEEMNA